MALPLNASSQETDGNVDLLDDLNDSTVNLSSIFEQACEVKVIDVNEDDFPPTSSVEVVRPKRRKTSTRLWKKATTFDKDILQSHWTILLTHINIYSFTDLMNWRLFVTDDLLSTVVKQTNLFANRDKNDPSFTTSKPEIFRFFGILWSGYHSLPLKTDYWSNQVDLGVSVVAETLKHQAIQKG